MLFVEQGPDLNMCSCVDYALFLGSLKNVNSKRQPSYIVSYAVTSSFLTMQRQTGLALRRSELIEIPTSSNFLLVIPKVVSKPARKGQPL